MTVQFIALIVSLALNVILLFAIAMLLDRIKK